MGVSSSEVARTYSYIEDDLLRIPEKQDALVTECPPSITEDLERASFKPGKKDNEYVKYQKSLSGKERQVAKVSLYGDIAHVSVEDSVGILTFTPEIRISVEPKLPWEAVVEMLLSVYQWNRGPEYHGIPLDDFISGDVGLDDIFLIFAINYLDALRPIRRNGFVRELPTKRSQLESPRGNIDIAESLSNPDPLKHSCIYTETNYDTPVNSLLHFAGVRLLRTYQRTVVEDDRSPANEQQYNRVFAEVNTMVQRMEDLGITSDPERVREYHRVSADELPPSRHYYNRAIDIARTIISSSLGYKVGKQELIVDYVLNMDSLFEEYSQVALEQELESIKQADYLGILADVTVKSEPDQYPYVESKTYKRNPDHVLTVENEKQWTGYRNEGVVQYPDDSIQERTREFQGTDEHGSPLAVMDSKHYNKERNPMSKSSARAQMLSYGYLLAAGRLAFLTPFGPSREYTLETGAVLNTITPDSSSFTTKQYRHALRKYLLKVLTAEFGDIVSVFVDVDENALALEGVDSEGLAELGGPDSENPFEYTRNPERFAYDTLEGVKNALDITDSDLENEWLLGRLRREYKSVEVSSKMKRLRAVPVVDEEKLGAGTETFGTLRIHFLEQTGNEDFEYLDVGGQNPVEVNVR